MGAKSFLASSSCFFHAAMIADLSSCSVSWAGSAWSALSCPIFAPSAPLVRTDCGGFLVVWCSCSSGRNTPLVVVMHILPGTSAHSSTGEKRPGR